MTSTPASVHLFGAVLFLVVLTVYAEQDFMIVNLNDVPIQSQISVQACAGFLNRNLNNTGVFTIMTTADDMLWLQELKGINETNIVYTPIATVLSECFKVVKGRLRYNYTTQQLIVPNILTIAAVLDAVPMEDSDPSAANTTVVFDATVKLEGFTALQATSFVYENFAPMTSTLAWMNPGLDDHTHPLNPRNLTKDPNPRLIDFIIKERLFNFYLYDGCVPGTKEHALLEIIAEDNSWPRPISVYGYDDTFPIAGDLFEAETTCVSQHNMGQIASDGINNLSFYTRTSAITEPIAQPASPGITWSHNKTYIGFVVGDGDNLSYMKGSRAHWMTERVEKCQADPSSKGCFPLGWSTSPHLLNVAPDILKWYYEKLHVTGHDYVVLPPSGHLYAYPSLMGEEDQNSFVSMTEDDCRLLGCNGTVDWEWFTNWGSAIDTFFPKYASANVINAVFAVNVPFFIPVLEFGIEHYILLDGKTAVFRPREWRGSGKCSIPLCKPDYKTPQEMADELNTYPKGTVSYIYLTSDGGANLDSFYNLVALLDDHVEIVDPNQLGHLAVQRG